jgi:hypothetical protein
MRSRTRSEGWSRVRTLFRILRAILDARAISRGTYGKRVARRSVMRRVGRWLR